jgi:glycosyltransferase involved in cell wall biosynthesis
MKITYLYQSDGYTISQPRAASIHIVSIMKHLLLLRHSARLMTLFGRKVLLTANLQALLEKTLTSEDFCDPGISENKTFRFVESGIRRIQRSIHFPYLALFDSLRIAEAATRNLQETDVIHERYNLMSIGGSLASKRLKKPHILEFNGDMIQEQQIRGNPLKGIQRKYAIWSTRFALDQAKKIIAVSEELKAHLINHWEIASEKIIVFPNAADLDQFGSPHDTLRVRKSLGLDQEPVIVFVGGFYIWHDLDLLIESFQQVREQYPKVKLILVGDGETRLRIEARIAESNLSQSIILTGLVDHSKIPEILSIATVSVAPLTKLQDGYGCSPLKIYEYMAAGNAIVATDTGQVSTIISHNKTGVLVDPGDITGFANAITRLLDNPMLANEIGDQARKQAIANYSWIDYSNKLIQLYQSVIQDTAR